MAITIENKTYRNLQEQVQKNKEDIANHYNIDRVLADFGIRVLGQVATEGDLPEEETYEGEYGDAYAVGTTSPYDFYVWTRANHDAGHDNDYWFNIGKLAIVGPQGPQGQKGEKGDTGESTRWHTGLTNPSSSQQYNEWDLYLNTVTGMTYRYVNIGGNMVWQQMSSIKGPTGAQGPQGETGPQGEQGIQGPKGDTGDVGGFINIAGIIASISQLPDPAILHDLTKAYLVGSADPYDLFIQVGSTSEEATWNNMGPLNVATYITVNGEFQNTWDADTKLDKVTTAGNKRVYGINAIGEQTVYNVTETSGSGAPWTLVQRDGSRRLKSSYPIGCYDNILFTLNTDDYVITRGWMDQRLYNKGILDYSGKYTGMTQAGAIASTQSMLIYNGRIKKNATDTTTYPYDFTIYFPRTSSTAQDKIDFPEFIERFMDCIDDDWGEGEFWVPINIKGTVAGEAIYGLLYQGDHFDEDEDVFRRELTIATHGTNGLNYWYFAYADYDAIEESYNNAYNTSYVTEHTHTGITAYLNEFDTENWF